MREKLDGGIMGDCFGHGVSSYQILQALSRLLRHHHGRGMKPCSFCDCVLQVSLLDHVLDVHGDRQCNEITDCGPADIPFFFSINQIQDLCVFKLPINLNKYFDMTTFFNHVVQVRARASLAMDGLCQSCCQTPSKYRCPRCSWRSCW